MKRREFLALAQLAAVSQSRLGAQPAGPRSFSVHIPEAKIRQILRRVRETRWPERMDATDWRYGVSWDYMKQLVDYWTTKFDWRKAEKNLNRYPQFVARVDDLDIHYYHVRGKGPRPLPLILTHGWPGSVFEFLEVIGPLTDPAAHGGQAEDAFDVVVPSLPGYGFSSKPKKVTGAPTTAGLWHKLMTETLGYAKFGAQGGDLGSGITVSLGRMFPQSVVGIHLNGAGAGIAPGTEQNDAERTWAKELATFNINERDYLNEQQHKTQTIGFALADNPLGAAAWMVEKFKGWSDSPVNEPVFSKDQLLTAIMIYLVTDTMDSAFWFYRALQDDRSTATGKVTVPTAFASFPREMALLHPPRTLLERSYNLVQYTEMPRGGHFAALEQPQLLTEDLRKFFGKLRS
jgi:microsomal epoxide hydrolase